MRRSVMVALAAAVTVGVALVGAPAAEAGPSPHPAPAPVADYAPPPIVWGACTVAAFPGLSAGQVAHLDRDAAQCGFLTVPMDYARPKGPTIQLAVSRIKHVTAGAGQGPMLVNPGGPGGAGLNLAYLRDSVGPDLPDGSMAGAKGPAGDYDWIGFDPRGVGSSKPAISCIPDYAGYDRPDYEPSKTPGTIGVWLRKSAGYAAACRKNGAILDHLTTVDTVKDMNSIRKALGAPQINYYGFSYGTYLGQVYATLFPQHLRRAVFDGVVRASGVWYGDNIDQDFAFETSIKVFFGWVAKYDAIYHLGTTEAAVESLYYSTQAKLRKAPAGGKIGPAEWTDIFTYAGYYVFGWEEVATVFSDYVKTGRAQPLIDEYAGVNDTTDDNGYAGYLAVQCTDNQWPPVVKTLFDNVRVSRRAPFLTWSNGWFNAPCSFWPARAQRPVRVDGSKVGPILMINETLDPATPYNGALETRELFPNSSLIEGVGGTTHAGSLSGVACTDNAIATYLATGATPPRVRGNRSDKQCPPVPQPDAAADAAAAASSGGAGSAVAGRSRIG